VFDASTSPPKEDTPYRRGHDLQDRERGPVAAIAAAAAHIRVAARRPDRRGSQDDAHRVTVNLQPSHNAFALLRYRDLELVRALPKYVEALAANEVGICFERASV
jgi:hypothetical protein